ncbi:hypothetical protein [Desulfatibacillum aliphaticivorans]|uniref:hypothetical protein n=1 Tax=Desulfatibacillum aliphaticivorans TaxID=218208 RepID=UPI0006860D73|nr:hypothetical protein [Desulfatibacillum aliphaticivorans]
MKTGVELIAAERLRQIEEEGWSVYHDVKEHRNGELAMVASCFAAPRQIFIQTTSDNGMCFYDPWPKSWQEGWDKRPRNLVGMGRRIDYNGFKPGQRFDILVKAGALIAAELDRLLELEQLSQLTEGKNNG